MEEANLGKNTVALYYLEKISRFRRGTTHTKYSSCIVATAAHYENTWVGLHEKGDLQTRMGHLSSFSVTNCQRVSPHGST